MKKLVLVVLFFWIGTLSVWAQYGMDEPPPESRGFGAPVLKITSLNDETVVFLGGRIGLVLNHKLLIGASAYRMLSRIDTPEEANIALNAAEPLEIDMDYLGLDLGYVFAPHQLFHFALHTLIGTGQVQYWEGEGRVLTSDGIFVFEPAANVIYNVTDFFRIATGVSYRHVLDVERLTGLENRDLRGFGVNLALKFGRF